MGRYRTTILAPALVLLVAAACGSNGDSDPTSVATGTETLAGTISVIGNTAIVGTTQPGTGNLSIERNAVGSKCTGDGGYGDLQAGADVTVKDETGTIIALGSLNEGTLDEITLSASSTIGVGLCSWVFDVPDVPGDRSFYSVEVSDRGEVRYSNADLTESAWTVSLSLGS